MLFYRRRTKISLNYLCTDYMFKMYNCSPFKFWRGWSSYWAGKGYGVTFVCCYNTLRNHCIQTWCFKIVNIIVGAFKIFRSIQVIKILKNLRANIWLTLLLKICYHYFYGQSFVIINIHMFYIDHFTCPEYCKCAD